MTPVLGALVAVAISAGPIAEASQGIAVDVASLVGDYDGGSVLIKVRSTNEGALTYEVPGQPLYTLVAGNGLRFSVERQPDLSIEFRGDTDGTVFELISHQLNGHVPALRVSAEHPERSVLASLVGEYQVPTLTVSIRQGRDESLILSVPGQPDGMLRHANRLRFMVQGVAGVWIEFRRDAAGVVTELVSHQLNGDVVATRKKK